jgi:site-specific recombinase
MLWQYIPGRIRKDVFCSAALGFAPAMACSKDVKLFVLKTGSKLLGLLSLSLSLSLSLCLFLRQCFEQP